MNKRILLLLFFFLTLHGVKSQLSKGGRPDWLFNRQNVNELLISAPDYSKISHEDTLAEKAGNPFRFAVNIPVNISLSNSGLWEDIAGGRLWRLKIRVPGALALGGYYSHFSVPEGARFYISNEDGSEIIGAFTKENNQENGLFATELIMGECLVLNYFEPFTAYNQGIIELNELAYAYRGIAYSKRGFGGSGPCEVNINCPEGNDWQDEKRGVVRIQVKVGGSSFWCTGTLLNNTNQDYSPYILTADHCGYDATPSDLSQWVFYFNYEGLDCPNPNQEPAKKSMVGAVKKAAAGGHGQVVSSDYYLVLLNNHVPDSYNPFYNGWTRLGVASPSGVCIHHPQGDIKKISTYTSPTTSSTWGTTPNTHWELKWAATTTNHGVTEGGSSGSPLFDNNGLVIGSLSGGESSCSALNLTDLFGKLSYSWSPPGSVDSTSLHAWLDPGNTGALFVPPLNNNITYVVANFSADDDTIVVGTSINYTDLCSGSPTGWNWKFDGGSPAVSTDKNPSNILYNKPGVFTSRLIATNGQTTDTVEKKRYITVIPNIYPNPFAGRLEIDLGDAQAGEYSFEVYNILGQSIPCFITETVSGSHFRLGFYDQVPGVYFLKFKSTGLTLNKKIVLMKKK